MFLSIRHTTSYVYDQPVILEPHIIRLTPRGDSYRRLMEHNLTIMPEPDGSSINLDANGNIEHVVWFKRQTAALNVISRIVVELNESNPFGFVVSPHSCVSLPMQYPVEIRQMLKPYMLVAPLHEKVVDFAVSAMQESGHNILEFCPLLSRKVREECMYEVRDKGAPMTPEKLLSTRKGSCRDMAVLYIAAARAAGLAARFVSGYYFDQSPKTPQLHAWAEVFIPGGGWRGFDPTLGLSCYGHHIALAAAADPAQAAVVDGTFLGKPGCNMEVSIEYEYLKQLSRAVEF